MRLAIYALLVISLSSCQFQDKSSSECGDRMIAKAVENCLLTVAMIRSGQSVSFEDRWQSIECLDALAGHESQIVKDSDAPYLYYRGGSDEEANEKYRQDFLTWLTWWENNRCTVTQEDVKKAFKAREKILGDKLGWPDPFYSHLRDDTGY